MSLEQVCTYCGILADSEDHVVPRHLLERAGELELDLSRVMRMRAWIVPACRPRAQAEIVAAVAVRDWVRGRLRWKGAREVEDISSVFRLAHDMARRGS